MNLLEINWLQFWVLASWHFSHDRNGSFLPYTSVLLLFSFFFWGGDGEAVKISDFFPPHFYFFLPLLCVLKRKEITTIKHGIFPISHWKVGKKTRRKECLHGPNAAFLPSIPMKPQSPPSAFFVFSFQHKYY